MRLSILDIQAPIHLPEVVAVAEETGYHRYWVSEHYAPRQSASPTLATALAGGVSDRLRVGMGGVLLRRHEPLRVAADIALLRTFFPGRIDLGIAGAAGGDSTPPIADDATYHARIVELIRLATDASVPCAAFAEGEPPQVWLCGTSIASARVAGALGLRYAYHHHLAPKPPGERAAISRAYRDAFRPSAVTATPYFAIAAYGAVARDDGAARRHWLSTGGSDRNPASFVGAAADAGDQLAALGAEYAADEIFVDCFATAQSARIDGLRALADALDLAALARSADEITVETAPLGL